MGHFRTGQTRPVVGIWRISRALSVFGGSTEMGTRFQFPIAAIQKQHWNRNGEVCATLADQSRRLSRR